MFEPATMQMTEGRQSRLRRRVTELMRPVSIMQHPLRRLSAAAIVATTSFLGFMSLPGWGSPAPYDADKVPGVHARADCHRGTAYVEVGNTDMAGSTIEVTIDGVRRPDLHVDSRGDLQQWYSLPPNQPHRLSIIYDFVPGGTVDEENQVITVSCLDGQPLKGTAHDGNGGDPVSPPVGSTFTLSVPPKMWDSRSGQCTGSLDHAHAITPSGVRGGPLGG